MARRFVIDDSEWKEVRFINGYAVFMGYLLMGVRGLGVLVLTWTTVVLLGGFVSDLGNKDFWCLTGISLVQTAGVFNIVLEETMSDLVRSGWGLLLAAIVMALRAFKEVSFMAMLLAFFILGIQALMLVIIICPVVVLYVLGIYISAGVGLWRLIQHDFDSNNAQGAGANLKPALQVLYSLAVAQGVLYGYKIIHAYAAKDWLAVLLDISIYQDLLTAYIEETVKGCEKDPSFASERNLVTYAVDLMVDAKSNDSFIASIKILGIAIDYSFMEPDRMVLAKHLLTRPSSSFIQVTQRLLDMLGSRSPYNGKIRAHTARIVALIASCIHLEEHPGWIHSILSMFETFEDYNWRPESYDRDGRLPEEYERDWLLEKYEKEFHYKRNKGESSTSIIHGYKDLMLEGVNILKKLALHPENRRVIMNTQGLLTKIMAPMNSMQLHRDEHGVWATIERESFSLIVVIQEETGTKPQAYLSLECILECLKCGVAPKIRIVEVHLQLSSSSMKASGSSGRIFNWILLLIFLLPGEEVSDYSGQKEIKISRDTSRLAGEKKLITWNQAELPLRQSVGYVLEDLTAALVSAGGDMSTRVHAAKILEYLVRRYEKNDEFLKELKKIMVSIMPQVLNEILGRGSTGKSIKTKEANIQPPSSQDADIEMGSVSGGGEQASSSQQQTGHEVEYMKRRLREELTALCLAITNRWKYYYNRDADLVRQLDEIARKVCLEHGRPAVNTNFKILVDEEWAKYR